MARKRSATRTPPAPESREPAAGARSTVGHEPATKADEACEKRIDDAVDMTFPASDPTASGRATGTEPPARPPDRRAPLPTKEEVERAARKRH